MNNTHNNQIPDLSEAELLLMIDGGKDVTHGYDELFSRIEKTKAFIVPGEAFMGKLLAALPGASGIVTSGELSGTKSPYPASPAYPDTTRRFAWFSAATLSSWKVATPVAVVVLMLSIMIGRQSNKQGEPIATAMPMAVNVMQMQVENGIVSPDASGALAADTHAPVQQAGMMMAKRASAPSSADGVIALLSSEANADASTTTTNSDISLLSIDPSTVTDLNQTYDAATN